MKTTASTFNDLSGVWSCLDFGAPELRDYAAPVITDETRRGVALLSLVALLFLALAAAMSAVFALGSAYTYTYSVLCLLALHVYLSSAKVEQLRALYLLAMLLLVVCGSSLVLLAQRSGHLHAMLLLSVAVLIMLVPVVPWGLREAALTTGAIYLMFTASTYLSRLRFAALDLWVLQCLMLVAAVISLALVARALGLRKHDLALRFHLEQAQRELTELVNRDHLTGAWNRRHIERDFDRVVAHHHGAGIPCWFGLFDIDRFKAINDTFGHGCGDEVLRAVQVAFGGLAGDVEYLARLGGDEFALLLCGRDAPARVEAALASIAGKMACTVSCSVQPTVSLGLVQLPREGSLGFDGAYKLADELLYAAKRAGGNAVHVSAPAEPEKAVA
ncbi:MULTISPECIES: GGDEF domain-containing protein [unclassified Massilia]|uniref:GGDEF domain-containing protein n=1 Tax=unclassified Massilia TaxID=2609279 RepID=UPI001783AC4A|nr:MULTISPECIES: GGDEF domain-containing protein [unclassified Massilia]MBD8531738.1 GGDEF domain-containing protein [Massilia sp. CFBP 13647]MBD8675183.1 GGDEF domain-containing protein [Massilia sp. CFBP 13721]